MTAGDVAPPAVATAPVTGGGTPALERVLVTGATGMLGRAVAAAVHVRGHSVRTFQRGPAGLPGIADARGSVTDPDAVARALEDCTGVVHLAAKVGIAGTESEFRAVNVEGTRTLLAAARGAGVRRFVMVSSPSVAHVGASIVGAGADPADPERTRGPYPRTKAAAELLALAADSPEMRVLAVRPHVVWGPGDTQLVGRVVDRSRRGRLPLLGSGAALIDTTYVDNAADALVAALEAPADAWGAVYVVTNGEPRPVRDLIAGICRAAGAPVPDRSVPPVVARVLGGIVEAAWAARPGWGEPPLTRFVADQLSTAHWFDQRRTREALRWVPAVTLDEGFTRLAAHFAESRRTA